MHHSTDAKAVCCWVHPMIVEILHALHAKHAITCPYRICLEANERRALAPSSSPANCGTGWRPGRPTRSTSPGSPWQNGFRESFHGRFRDEFLYGTLFASLSEMKVLVEGFRQEYNTDRPHQSLGYLTPSEFKQDWLKEHNATKLV
jgi:hypothetical protein